MKKKKTKYNCIHFTVDNVADDLHQKEAEGSISPSLICENNLDDISLQAKADNNKAEANESSDKCETAAPSSNEDRNSKDHTSPPIESVNADVTTSSGHPKSCLSRHNSTHTSIKKRVNISTHAEIIEPEPLPPLLVKSASLGDDEDDVFSDSLPPPKRDSMCAPYIERDDDIHDVVSDTLAYSHGLPEWFNDERINDM